MALDTFDSFFADMDKDGENLFLAAASDGPMTVPKTPLSPIGDFPEFQLNFEPNFEPMSDGELQESPRYEPKSPPPSSQTEAIPTTTITDTETETTTAAASDGPMTVPQEEKRQRIPRQEPKLAVKRKISPIRPPTPNKKFVRRPKRLDDAQQQQQRGGAGAGHFNNKNVVDPSIPPQSRAPWKPQKSFKPFTSQILRHSINYVLAIREGEFVLTDGYRSVYKCHPRDWAQQLERELSCLMKKVRSVFCADEATFNWLSTLKQRWDADHPINRIPVHVWNGCPELGPCSFCMRTNCVRWLAIRGGVQRFLRYEIDMMEH